MPNFTSSVTLEENALIRKVAWRLMPLMMVSYFFAFFDRINIGFAKSQLQLDIGLSNTAYGLGASAFVVGYVIFEIPSSVMLYRTGARQWIARIMFSWGLATAAMMFIREPWHFYGLRFLVGALEAGFGPGALYYLSIWFPTSHRGRITSYFFIASAFSGPSALRSPSAPGRSPAKRTRSSPGTAKWTQTGMRRHAAIARSGSVRAATSISTT